MKKSSEFTGPQQAASAVVCAYAAQTLAPRLERMLAEAKQAKRGKRPEPIHQMRVWSRRSRAALEMFAPCFSGRKFDAVAQSIHDVTGALGAARDLDVMILTLRDRADALPDAQRAGLFAFVKTLEQRRRAAQRPVVRAVRRMKRNHAAQFASSLAEVAAAPSDFSAATGRAKQGKRRKTSSEVDTGAELTANAARLITRRLNALQEYESCLDDAGAIAQHHAMRIAAKKLRYTMDIFQEAVTAKLPDAAPFVKALESVKLLQEHLGQIHDADLLAPQLAGYLAEMIQDGYGLKTKKGAKKVPNVGVHCVSFDACAGVVTLCRETETRRDERFGLLKRDWSELKSSGVFEALAAALKAAQIPAPPAEAEPEALAPEAIDLPEPPVLEIVLGSETPAASAPPVEPNLEEENSYEEARIEPVTADGSRPVARTLRARRAPAANSGGRSQSGANPAASAAKGGLPQSDAGKSGKPE